MSKARDVKFSDLSSVALLPLEGALLLPRTILPLHIFEPRYLELIDDVLGGSRILGIIQPNLGDEGTNPALQNVGTLGRITHFEEIEDDRYMIGLHGISRFTLTHEHEQSEKPYRIGDIDLTSFETDLIAGFGENSIDRQRFVKLLKSYAEFAEFDLDWDEINEASLEDLINSCSMASPYEARERQALLEADTLSTRAEMLMAFAEIEMSRQASNITMQ
ncbi:LON peptidase substrate-binding domain-containing protein [Maritalea sp.]|uniref:LON peptidase substrate-binding domain-containing protein n=1 Tax=Maritalea sp. TaxID=2003361 RepID=UPI003EF4B79A